MRSTIIVAVAAIGLITSASAQEVDQNHRQQIERIAAAYVENWNKHDAAGIAALYAKDGQQVTATGVKSGTQEIEQVYQSAMKMFPQHNGQTIEQISRWETTLIFALASSTSAARDRTAPPSSTGVILRSMCAKGGHGKFGF
jgi:uncharacterized protein (TIGR02246 family)